MTETKPDTSPEAAAFGPGYRSAVLAMLLLVYTFNFLDRQILSILAPSIQADLKLEDGQLGLMGGLAFALFYTALGIPIAALADRTSRTWIMTGALTVWSGFTAVCGLATGFWQLFFARMGVGVGEAGGVAPAYSLISDYFPASQRTRALSVYSFGIPIGTAAGALFGGLIAHSLGWRMSFVIVGLAGVVLAVPFRLLVKEPPRALEIKNGAAAIAQPPRLGATLKLLAAKKSFWLLSFGAASSSVCGYGVSFWLPSFLTRSLGLPLVNISWFVAGFYLIGGLAGIWLSGMLSDRLRAKGADRGVYPLIPAVAFVIALPLFFLAASTPSLAIAFVLLAVMTGLNLAWLGPIIAAVQHLTPGTMRSTGSAAFLFINNLLGLGLGTYYFGAMSTLLKPHFGVESLRYAMYSGVAFYGVAVVLFILASRTLKRDWVD
jgi:MFS family permease